MKIAIVGSGIAGLSAGYFLEKEGCDVTLLEQQARAGLSAHNVAFSPGGTRVVSDLPLRMLSRTHWPALWGLYQELGVSLCPINMSLTLGQLEHKNPVVFRDALNPFMNVSAFFCSKARRIARESIRLRQMGIADLAGGIPNQISLAGYLESKKVSHDFVHSFLYPVLSTTVLTCSYESVGRYPATIVLQALNDFVTEGQMFRVRGGSSIATDRLTSKITCNTGTTVRSIRKRDSGVAISLKTPLRADHEEVSFDGVVIATRANQAIRLLPRSGPQIDGQHKLHTALEKITYESVNIVVHTDRSLMPADQNRWSTFNMISNPDLNRAMCSIWMNRFSEWPDVGQQVFQTINPLYDPDSDKVISGVRIQRPVVTAENALVWREIANWNQNASRIWLAGSYAVQGIPLLDSAVRSARRVADEVLRERQK